MKLFYQDIIDLTGMKPSTLSVKLRKFGIAPKGIRRKYKWLDWWEAKKYLNAKVPKNRKILSFYSPKGGIGKTTLAREIGIRAYTWGLRVLFVDLDFNCTLTSSLLNYKKHYCLYSAIIGEKSLEEITIRLMGDGLDLIPSGYGNSLIDEYLSEKKDFEVLSKLFHPYFEDYDLVIFDSPPSNTSVTKLVNDLSNNIIIPVIPDLFSINTLPHIIESAKGKAGQNDLKVKIILNKFDSRISNQKLMREQIFTNSKFRPFICENVISTSQFISDVRTQFESIFSFNPIRKCQKEISSLTKELLGIEYEGQV